MTTVLIAGVAVIDFVMSLDAMPRRAEKYRARDATVVGGGCAANAAVAVARLGGRARLATRLGGDAIGDMIVAGLEADGVDCTLARRFSGARSPFSSVYVDAAGERQIVSYRDWSISPAADWLEAAMPDAFDAALADTRWPEGARAAMAAARALSRPGIIDAEPPVAEAGEAIALASHVAFSAQGLADYAGVDGLEAGLRAAARACGAWVCVTDGGNGVAWLDGDTVRRLPAYPVEAVDTLGAGDVWHGGFALALGEGRDVAQALRFAGAVAAIKCTRFGGGRGTPTRAEVDSFMGERA
ncbi:PfkB family carbohydrate kinase [Aquibium sp. A9E412]|uniref:PfkB family carbohydrate kinase n=1 Tax=Aquibium sp. A9E412 TaxID=2976767 RepID=UPI0025B0ACFE|nr:PfkB family carbohydrate kinase [Aquibium sp. A9E412]MDN2566785.1 PfkB family carbohydrate kinase [Aquibium sp. A9E412]